MKPFSITSSLLLQHSEYYENQSSIYPCVYLSVELYDICNNLSNESILKVLKRCKEISGFEFEQRRLKSFDTSICIHRVKQSQCDSIIKMILEHMKDEASKLMKKRGNM